MLPKTHTIINFIICLFLLFFFPPFFVLIIFLSSVLIDVDHYVYYIFKKKIFSLKSAYNWFLLNKKKLLSVSKKERDKHRRFIFIFHGIEPLIILLILSQYSVLFEYVFIGFLIHLIEDLYEAHQLGVFRKKLFLTYSIYHHYKYSV